MSVCLYSYFQEKEVIEWVMGKGGWSVWILEQEEMEKQEQEEEEELERQLQEWRGRGLEREEREERDIMG